MIKCVCHPEIILDPGIVSNPYPKSTPSKPKAGINTLIPPPADLFNSKGLYSLYSFHELPASRKVSAYIDAEGLSVIGYLNSNATLL